MRKTCCSYPITCDFGWSRSNAETQKKKKKKKKLLFPYKHLHISRKVTNPYVTQPHVDGQQVAIGTFGNKGTHTWTPDPFCFFSPPNSRKFTLFTCLSVLAVLSNITIEPLLPLNGKGTLQNGRVIKVIYGVVKRDGRHTDPPGKWLQQGRQEAECCPHIFRLALSAPIWQKCSKHWHYFCVGEISLPAAYTVCNS
jgi:hypothetical protein